MESTENFVLPAVFPERLGLLLEAEFLAFEHNYLNRITEVQDLRALLLCWFALFLPEAFPRGLVDRASEFRFAASKEIDFSCHGWYRMLPLDAALFAITGEQRRIVNHMLNFDHHKSSIRNVVLKTLSLVAHRIPFGDKELLKGCENNLRVRHGNCEWGTVVALLGSGFPSVKRQILQQWLRSHELNTPERALLTELFEFGMVSNSYLGAHLHWVTRYVLLRILTFSQLAPPPATGTEPRCADIHEISATTIWKRLGEHPLASAYIVIPLK